MKKLLIVEDSDDSREQVTEALGEIENLSISEVRDSKEGYDKLIQEAFDIIVLDYHLPAMTGIEMLRRLANDGHAVSCPVIMLSTEMEERGSEIKKLNVVTWVIKPFNKERIKDIVLHVLDSYGEKKN